MERRDNRYRILGWVLFATAAAPTLYVLMMVYREPLFRLLWLPWLAYAAWRIYLICIENDDKPAPPRNMLTHRDETVAAMMQVEYPISWLVFQRDEDPYSLKVVEEELKRLHREHPEVAEDGERRIAMCIRDSDGRAAWGVTPFGEVLYLRAGEKTYAKAVRAKEFGFRIADAPRSVA